MAAGKLHPLLVDQGGLAVGGLFDAGWLVLAGLRGSPPKHLEDLLAIVKSWVPFETADLSPPPDWTEKMRWARLELAEAQIELAVSPEAAAMEARLRAESAISAEQRWGQLLTQKGRLFLEPVVRDRLRLLV